MIGLGRQVRKPLRRIVRTMLIASPRLVPAGIVLVSLITAGTVLLYQANAMGERRQHLLDEGRLGLESALEHVEEYFDAVYSALLFISLDDAVKGLRADSRSFIQRLYDHQWEEHRLSEVYVIEREFTGTNRPFLTFERGTEERTAEDTHNLLRETEEYQQQKEHLRQFAANTNLLALLSPEIPLCTDTPDGQRAHGFVYSVPIHSAQGLQGLVAGMIPTHILQAVLRKGGLVEMPLLVNGRGEMHGGRFLDEAVRTWFHAAFALEPPEVFFERHPGTFQVGRWTAISSSARIISAEKWWVVYLYDEHRQLGAGFFSGMPAAYVLALLLMLTGTTLGLLSRAVTNRFQEQVRHMRERQDLERQVQEASEREQRRIGENLHEDLCQRLAGIRAASQALSRKLKGEGFSEAELASEIAGELHESLRRAQQLADDLQPVALLEEGFVAALERLAESTQQRSGICCDFERTDFPTISDPVVATHLYRIVQEALHNAVQHSGAKRITVALTSGRDGLTISIHDDGTGLPPQARSAPGVGLRLMQYRTDLIGGKLIVESSPQLGTEVLCRVRLSAQQTTDDSVTSRPDAAVAAPRNE